MDVTQPNGKRNMFSLTIFKGLITCYVLLLENAGKDDANFWLPEVGQ